MSVGSLDEWGGADGGRRTGEAQAQKYKVQVTSGAYILHDFAVSSRNRHGCCCAGCTDGLSVHGVTYREAQSQTDNVHLKPMCFRHLQSKLLCHTVPHLFGAAVE
jgi:hypothetical protein